MLVIDLQIVCTNCYWFVEGSHDQWSSFFIFALFPTKVGGLAEMFHGDDVYKAVIGLDVTGNKRNLSNPSSHSSNGLSPPIGRKQQSRKKHRRDLAGETLTLVLNLWWVLFVEAGIFAGADPGFYKGGVDTRCNQICCFIFFKIFFIFFIFFYC